MIGIACLAAMATVAIPAAVPTVAAGSAQASETIRLSTPAVPPFIRGPDGKPGLLDVVLGSAFSELGLLLELVSVPAERSLMNADAGIDDGEAFRIGGLERQYPNLLRVPESVYTMEFVVVARDGVAPVARWDDLKDRSVGIINGWKLAEDRLAGVAKVTSVGTPGQLFDMLERGRVDYGISVRPVANRFMARGQWKNGTIQEPPVERQEMFIYLHKKHAALADRLAETLRRMKESGRYAQLTASVMADRSTN